MNRKNFPGRKNRRRMESLEKWERVKRPTFAQQNEIASLKRRIVSPIQALTTYTKKWRGTGEPPLNSRAS